jgi:CheY-like chemotaxis protein
MAINFQTLLVSTDNDAIAVLGPVLSGLGLDLRCCRYETATPELSAQRFDAIIVDFEDPQEAGVVLQNAYLISPHSAAVTVALLRDQTRVRQAFGAGAHFVLYKPITAEQAQTSLRAATILLKRERRRSSRVPIQIPVQLNVAGANIEAILLDLSEEGMELLAARPLCPSALVALQFGLPGHLGPTSIQGEVAWASPNGQTGIRFVRLSASLRAGFAAWVAANVKKFPPDETEGTASFRLTDLSEGGCYVETESPFPENIVVSLSMKAGARGAQAEGVVRVMHPGFGMGIELFSRSSPSHKELFQFIRFLLDFPEAAPQLSVMPCGIVTAGDHSTGTYTQENDSNDILFNLLREESALSQEEFLQKLHSQRRPAALACRN